MDADGSHAPEDLPRLLDALSTHCDGAAGADVVLGSRYVPHGRVVNWPRYREWLSRGANYYARIALDVGINDLTGGFRAYRRHVLESVDLSTVASRGYCFQVDLAWRGLKAGYRVIEVPIVFVERERGDSKMSRKIVVEALVLTTLWGIRHRADQLRRRLRRPKVLAR
jgi:dolichol-phosphate mannosyltransferase